MHTDMFDYAVAAGASKPARPSVWRRLVLRMQRINVRYELDEHLARDIGATHYTAPLVPPFNQGG